MFPELSNHNIYYSSNKKLKILLTYTKYPNNGITFT